jgi:LPS O-antigen subunit length determinant protein (WzzB/FepE family)
LVCKRVKAAGPSMIAVLGMIIGVLFGCAVGLRERLLSNSNQTTEVSNADQ